MTTHEHEYEHEHVDLSKLSFKQKLDYFGSLPQYSQKSQQWLSQRNNYLTGSSIAIACDLSDTQSKVDLLLEKVTMGKHKPFTGNIATSWGNRYESCCTQIYSSRTGSTVYEFGLITNPKYPFLAISPDGITEHCLVEIKSPFSRIIDGHIKLEYYHQIQEQLLVTEFTDCDFLECQFDEIHNSQLFWDNWTYKDFEQGIILKYVCLHSGTITYVYSPIQLTFNKYALQNWLNDQLLLETVKHKLKVSNTMLLDVSFWRLKVYSCQRVKFDQNWYNEWFPKLSKFWEEIQMCCQMTQEQLDNYIKRKYLTQIEIEVQPVRKFNKCMC